MQEIGIVRFLNRSASVSWCRNDKFKSVQRKFKGIREMNA